ncbi:MAG: Crp/Fnr family transcriptional regulator [Mucilaginibacter sp.]
MPENDKLTKYIQEFGIMTDEEACYLSSCFKVAKIKKKQFIVQPNFTAKTRNFIVKGAMRAYVIGEKGDEHTILLGIENWWITDYDSYIYQQPASMFVVAMEDSTVLQLPFEKEQELKKANHSYEAFFRIRAEMAHAYQQQRLIASLTLSAEERYNAFAEKYPLIVQRVPQYVLASFLGMTTEFLSRIRSKKRKI